jgi:hypothetical protein
VYRRFLYLRNWHRTLRVRLYWEGFKRGDANMPFWDDINLTAIPEVSARLMLV